MKSILLNIGPVWRAMLRNKIGVLLIAVQIAFTMAVCINAYAMIKERVALMERPSGMVENELFHLTSTGFGEDFDGLATARRDLELIRSTPGVVNAVQLNAIPMSGSGWSMMLQLEADSAEEGTGVAVYMVDEHGLDTFGVELLAGQGFRASDVLVRSPAQSAWPPVGIITRAAAEALFPDLSLSRVIGQTVYIDSRQSLTLVGVIAHLQAPWSGSSIAEQSLLVPQVLDTVNSNYLVRTEPGRRDALVQVVEEALARSNTKRIVRNARTMAETRKRSYQLDSGLSRILQFVMLSLLLITGCGILGLASFSVRRRTKQIGTRRALGATRTDVLGYFLLESFLIGLVGVALGAMLSMGVNLLLVEQLDFPKIDWRHVPLAMAGLLVLSLLAALGPARRACGVSPAVATRTV